MVIKDILTHDELLFNASMVVYENGYVEISKLRKPMARSGNGGQVKKGQGKWCQYEENRKRSMLRSKSMLRQLIIENELTYHWVLTYQENMKEREQALKDFKKFIMKLNYKRDKNLKYVMVLETQKRGAYHIHLATDSRLDFKEMENLWGKGFVFVTEYSGDTGKVAGYLAKYFFEEQQKAPDNKKRYSCSDGLKRPKKVSINIKEEEFNGLSMFTEIKFEFETGVVEKWIRYRPQTDMGPEHWNQ